VYGARRIFKNAPMILQNFFSLPKIGAMRWMAKWQEQEDGSEKNFNIIVLAQRLVR
jgi:hypothetical protein